VRSDAFRQAAEAKDFARAPELFADDVVFNSPVVFTPYMGRDALVAILSAVAQVFEDFRYTDQVELGHTAALVFKARIGEREVEGVDVLRFGPQGQIEEMTVLVRPMSGMHALAERMKALLEEAGAA
jgi:hypothetical protein